MQTEGWRKTFGIVFAGAGEAWYATWCFMYEAP